MPQSQPPPPYRNLRPIPELPQPLPLSQCIISTITSLPSTWRTDLLSSVPPNLTPWFLPISDERHYEVYQRPIFENEGRWRYEYKVALTHITGYFDHDSGEGFMREFKSIVGITFGGRGMFDLMELIDSIEQFINGFTMRVEQVSQVPEPLPPVYNDEPEPTLPPAFAESSTIPRRTLQYESTHVPNTDSTSSQCRNQQSQITITSNECPIPCRCVQSQNEANNRWREQSPDIITLEPYNEQRPIAVYLNFNQASKLIISSPGRFINKTSRAIISSPGRLIKKCAGILHRIHLPSFSPVSVHKPDPQVDLPHISPGDREWIRAWTESIEPDQEPHRHSITVTEEAYLLEPAPDIEVRTPQSAGPNPRRAPHFRIPNRDPFFDGGAGQAHARFRERSG